jgi:hypothetical protein
MRVGISIITYENQNIWNNGIDQNVYHLATLLRGLPFIREVVLLNCGSTARPPKSSGPLGDAFPLVNLLEVSDDLDVAIEMSGALNDEWIARFRARGGKVVYHSCGNPYDIVEASLFGKGCSLGQPGRCDEIWILKKDMAFQAMLRSIHRAPVFEVPYLWASTFLDYNAKFALSEGAEFGYARDSLTRLGARVAIFEPNISPRKMGSIPFLICESAERQFPGLVTHVDLLNVAHLVQHQTFAHLFEMSNLRKSSKATFYGREFFATVMVHGANVVISHQIECEQNYLYFDALHGTYPLVHNSPAFSDVGYYYPLSDIGAGVDALRRACHLHDAEIDGYAIAARVKIAAVSPSNRHNLNAYAKRLMALVSNFRLAA